MSEVITDKLTGRATAGDVTITGEGGTGTMQLQKGIGKSWINVDMSNSNLVDESFNVASFTDNGTGLGQLNFTNSMDVDTFNDAVLSGTSLNGRVVGLDGTSSRSGTGSVAFRIYGIGSNAVVDSRAATILHGDLA